MDHAGRKKQLRAGSVASFASVIIGAVVLLNSCYYDNFGELYPAANNVSCDTSAVITFSKQVLPILNLYCNSCHSTRAANGGIILDTYSNVFSAAASGKLLASLQHVSGYPQMPLNGAIDPCYVNEIQTWIREGTQNN